jgi:hypothetical protein
VGKFFRPIIKITDFVGPEKLKFFFRDFFCRRPGGLGQVPYGLRGTTARPPFGQVPYGLRGTTALCAKGQGLPKFKRSLWGDKPSGLLPENCPNFFFFFCLGRPKKLKFFLPPVGNLPNFGPFGTECGSHN